ncbi:MAG TPA: PilZ domain-containing protein [Candidatus Omnitrophota bacterium]|jgi:hypothetical protein|nr:PilZ domain-containing protein [Candidatus Omnitrophota bacterium]HRZ15490.1 PilZ domain-containing protein [Candidatus Omnitrophota bacterium]
MSEESSGGGMEKRQFPRVEVNTAVKFSVVMPAVEEGISKDISQGGLCLHTKRALVQGTILHVDFDLPGDPPVHVEALGKVVWQRTDPDGSFATGIKFIS